MCDTKLHLYPEQFDSLERELCTHGGVSVSGFRYRTGVAALRVKSDRIEMIVLPFQGQQIWRCTVDGRQLAMESMFDGPNQTENYLATYGGFLLHCGLTGMGVPGPDDDHPLHGELPNARYQDAWLEIPQSDGLPRVSIGGSYEHQVSFNTHYVARPRITITESSSLFDVCFEVTNLRSGPMELMYMMHINFLPVDWGELVYSAPATTERVKVFVSVPTHMKAGAGLEELRGYLDRLSLEPEAHHYLDPALPYDPEVVFSIRYLADAAGWAHTMMLHPEGGAYYVAHRPEELPFGVRWIARTADEDALGMVLPATAEHQGYTAEKAKGHVVELEGGSTRKFQVSVGMLDDERAGEMRKNVAGLVGQSE